ncbi:MAG: ECF transporter S component [Clostridiales bacterium]|nr:ECF transporter S component [Clostridiales bacterium]
MRKNQSPDIKILTTTALMAAVIFVVTFVVRIPMPIAAGGYLNIGDAAVYIAASLLGGPWGMLAAAAGSALADLSAGYAIYILPTAVVKGMMGLICGRLMERTGFARFVVASVIGGAVMTGGYAAFDAVLFNVNQALAGAPFNMIQWGCGVAVAAALYPAVGRIRKGLRIQNHNPSQNVQKNIRKT